MWMALGSDPIIAGQIMEMAMEKLVVMAPYIDRKDPMTRGGLAKVATGQPLAVSPSPHLFFNHHPTSIIGCFLL